MPFANSPDHVLAGTILERSFDLVSAHIHKIYQLILNHHVSDLSLQPTLRCLTFAALIIESVVLLLKQPHIGAAFVTFREYNAFCIVFQEKRDIMFGCTLA
jgi:hypothetical protein